MKKKLLTALLILIVATNALSICFATINPSDYNPGTPTGYAAPIKMGGQILKGITSAGIVIAVAGMIILGVKYMIGSVEQRAEYKKSMLPFVIGAVLLFSITTIVRLAYDLTQKLS